MITGYTDSGCKLAVLCGLVIAMAVESIQAPPMVRHRAQTISTKSIPPKLNDHSNNRSRSYANFEGIEAIRARWAEANSVSQLATVKRNTCTYLVDDQEFPMEHQR